MMYSEFIEGTGCKENAHNYKVFCDLEAMYMNSNLSKAEIYEYGKKLVDNSKTPEEIAFEESIKAEIAELKDRIAYLKSEISYNEQMIEMWKQSNDKEMVQMNRRSIKYYKEEIKAARIKISELKWVLG